MTYSASRHLRAGQLWTAARTWGGWRPGFLRGMGPVFLAFLSSRLLILGIVLLSQTIVLPGPFGQAPGLFRFFLQWDAGWYLDIVRDGYSFQPGQQTTMGFLPFYPIMVKLASFVVRDIAIAGILVANLSLLAAGCLLQALIRLDHQDPRVGHIAVTLLMFNPVSFFFSSAYTESTFLMLALGSFFAARNQRWLIAGLLGMCVSATRQVGLLITLPLLVEYLHQNWPSPIKVRTLFQPRILLLGFVPVGLLLFMLYGWVAFGDFFAYFHTVALWGRKFTSPAATLATLPSNPVFHQWLFLGLFLVAGFTWGAGIFMRIRPSYSIYAVLLLAICICSNTMEAMPRCLSVVFPLYIALALLTRRFEWLYEPILASSIVLLTLCTVLSANGFWMT